MFSEKFWDAIAGVAWPIVVCLIFLRTWPSLRALLDSRRVSIKVAGIELNVAEAAENIGKQVADLQQKVAEIEQKVLISSLEGRISSAPAVNFDASASNSSSILWVDDYPSNNAFLIDKFQRGGVDVTVALSTEDALKHFSNRNFSVVITDLGRREAGVEKKFAGLELIQRLRSINAKLPILVFAGERGLQNRDKLIAAGASDVTASGSDLISFVEQHASVGI